MKYNPRGLPGPMSETSEEIFAGIQVCIMFGLSLFLIHKMFNLIKICFVDVDNKYISIKYLTLVFTVFSS